MDDPLLRIVLSALGGTALGVALSEATGSSLLFQQRKSKEFSKDDVKEVKDVKEPRGAQEDGADRLHRELVLARRRALVSSLLVDALRAGGLSPGGIVLKSLAGIPGPASSPGGLLELSALTSPTVVDGHHSDAAPTPVGITLAEARLARGAALLSGSIYKNKEALVQDAHQYFGIPCGDSSPLVCLARQHGGAKFGLVFLLRPTQQDHTHSHAHQPQPSVGEAPLRTTPPNCRGECAKCLAVWGVGGNAAIPHAVSRTNKAKASEQPAMWHDHPVPEPLGWQVSERGAAPAVGNETVLSPSPDRETEFLKLRPCDRGVLTDDATGSPLLDVLDGAYRRSDCIFITVRGSTTMGDWFANVQPVSLAQILPERLVGESSAQTRFGVTVHSAYFGRAKSILAELEFMDQGYQSVHGIPLLDRSRPMVICGHSMGGAVAALLAVLITDEWHWPSPVRVISFGSPPFGGEGLRRLAALDDIIRFVAPGDLVPTMGPPGYQHTGRTVSLAASPRKFSVATADSPNGRANASAGGKIAAGQLGLALGAAPHSVVGYRDRLCATLDSIEDSLLRSVSLQARL